LVAAPEAQCTDPSAHACRYRQYLPPDEILLDLRGFLVISIRDQGDELNLSPNDLAGLFNEFSSELIQLEN
jgi:hypothetical protein